jgi:ribonuclease HI
MPFRSYPLKKRSTPAESLDLFGSTDKSSTDKPRPDARLVAHVDGGSRGNPGHAGYGVFIQDGGGKPVAELSEYLGIQTNNFAEYSGLLAALRYAREHGCKAIEIVSDSELMVRQLNGQYKVKNEGLKPLYQQAMAMSRDLDWFKVRHVRREFNKDADRLANAAMDRKS